MSMMAEVGGQMQAASKVIHIPLYPRVYGGQTSRSSLLFRMDESRLDGLTEGG